jgi:hypothetical protein
MACSKYTSEFTEEFKTILESSDKTANEVLQAALKCLKKWKHCYTINQVLPKFFLTHSSNRGGLLLSPYNAHRNAARIDRGGADIKQLTNAIAMELAPHGRKRDSEIKANLDLIKRSNGLLAEVNGEERYLTLGCGHTVAFCKAADAGAKTSEKSIADAKGFIDQSKLKRNPQFKEMIEEGWFWTIIEHGIDEVFPAFAKIAQKALNVSNHVATTVSELETAINLAEMAEDPSITGVKDWQQIAVDHVRSLNVPAAEYAKTILDFVQLFGGGPGAPLIKLMDSFAKQFQCNTALGETFWVAVTTQQFPSAIDKLGLLRVAFCMANLTSPKIEDGIGKCIMKSDISKLASKKMFPVAKAADEVLGEGIECVKQASSVEAALGPLGKLFIRVALAITEKGDKGLEGKQYTIAEAKQLFLDGLSAVVGGTVTYSKWTDCKSPASAPAPASAASAASHVASLSDLNDPVWLAKQAGFDVGKVVVEKGASGPRTPTALWGIFSIGETVKLQQLCSYTDTLHKVDVDLAEFLTKWAVSNSVVPVQMPKGQQRPEILSTDGSRCLIYKAIQDLDAKQGSAANSLCFWRRPDEVRTASRPIPAGGLQLAPVAPLHNITTKGAATAAEVSHGDGEMFYVHPPAKPPLKPDQAIEWPDDSTIAAYWWVETTSDRKLCNMEYSYIEKQGFKIPVLTNSVELPPFTCLKRFVKPKPQVPSITSRLAVCDTMKGKGKATGKTAKPDTKRTATPLAKKAPPAKKPKN